MVEDEAIDGKDIPDAYNRDAHLLPDYAEPKFLEYGNLKEAKLAFEKEYINRKLFQHRNNVTKTAEAIGVGRSFLHKKIKSFKHD
jgi:two-component system nitrogen regulation response regulator NtrX